MLKKILFVLIMPLFLVACSNDDEPKPAVFMQIASITGEDGQTGRQFSYDAYGRITAFRSVSPSGSVDAKYEYVSDNLIKITTTEIIHGQIGLSNTVRTYQDELHLEKGRATYCDGLFSLTEGDNTPVEKKYRREFGYTAGNLLNTVKCTQWDKVIGEWADDNPWTWENYYYWEDGNLVKIEDFNGNTSPSITYTFSYGDVSGVQNVVPIPMEFHQYYPLQLKGIFGSMPERLISGIQRDDTSSGTLSTSFQYEIENGRVASYRELRDGTVSGSFSVAWSDGRHL